METYSHLLHLDSSAAFDFQFQKLHQRLQRAYPKNDGLMSIFPIENLRLTKTWLNSFIFFIFTSHDELTKIGVIFVRLYFKYFIFI